MGTIRFVTVFSAVLALAFAGCVDPLQTSQAAQGSDDGMVRLTVNTGGGGG
jgi:hypothetical protein